MKFKQVMANLLDIVNRQEKPDVKLTLPELEFLLLLIKNSNFKGEQIETIYNAAIKLQQQYIELQPKK
jgi:hypothetical protein